MAVGCVSPLLSEGDLCDDLLLVVDFAPSCSKLMEKSADGAIGVSNVFLLQFLDVQGIDGGDNEFDGDVGDRELCPPFSPEDVLVRFEVQLIESRCVLFDCTVDFSGLQEVAVCEGSASCAVDGSVKESEW